MGLMKRKLDGSGESNDLRQKPEEQDLFVEWLATPPHMREIKTYAELAPKLGVGESTLYYWKKQPAVIDKVKARVRDVLGVERLPQIVENLFDIANDDDAPSNARISASKTLLDWYEKTTPKEKTVGSLEEMSLSELQKLAENVWDVVEDRKPHAVPNPS